MKSRRMHGVAAEDFGMKSRGLRGAAAVAVVVVLALTAAAAGAEEFIAQERAYFGGTIAFGYTESDKGDDMLFGEKKLAVGYYGDRFYGAVFEERDRADAERFYDWLVWADKTTGAQAARRVTDVRDSFYSAFCAYVLHYRYFAPLAAARFMDADAAFRLMEANRVALVKTPRRSGFCWRIFDTTLYNACAGSSAQS